MVVCVLYMFWCVAVGFSFFFFFKQKTAYEMRISDWSSDVCSSDLCSPRTTARGSRRRSGKLAEIVFLRKQEARATGRIACGSGLQIGRASCRERVCQYV